MFLQVTTVAVAHRAPGATMAEKSKSTLVVSELALGTSHQQLRALFSEVGTIKVWI